MVVKERTSEVAHTHKLKVIKYVEVNEDDETHASFASREKQEIDALGLLGPALRPDVKSRGI